MAYSINLTIPKNTTIIEAVEYKLYIPPLKLDRMQITFPTGCVGLVGVWIEYRSSRLFPLNDGDYFRGNGTIIDVILGADLLEPPNVLSVRGFNLDDTYDHTPQIVLDVSFKVKVVTAREIQMALTEFKV